MSENRVKHLEMIQGVINRMGSNSFMLKSWSVILVSALFALGSKESQKCIVYLAYYPAVAFWVLDGYYLWQERLFRKLYDAMRKAHENEIDFSMSTKPFIKQVPGWLRTCFSKTVAIFHIAVLGSVLLVSLILKETP